MDTTHAPPIQRLQAALISDLLDGLDHGRRLRAARLLLLEASCAGHGLSDDEDAELAGWLSAVLKQLDV